MNKYLLLIIFIIVSLVISGLSYQFLPETIATHWGFSGNVNGYSPKGFGLFFFPVLLSVLFILFVILPQIDPLKENVRSFKNQYFTFISIIFLFLLYVQILVVLWNTGVQFDILRFLAPAFSVIFFYAGTMMEKSKRNWFMGIRTPWTLSSDSVWDKTHKQSGKLFKWSALLNLCSIVRPDLAMFFLFVPIIVSSIFAIAYSYVVYSRESK